MVKKWQNRSSLVKKCEKPCSVCGLRPSVSFCSASAKNFHFGASLKNITINHTTPVHQLTSWEDKTCVFVRNKSIKTYLISNRLKYESIIHIIASSSEKVVSSESGEKSVQIKHRLQAKTALNKYVDGLWCERQHKMDFFTGGSVIMDYGLVF